MIVQIDTAGPGTETYRSTKFAASVNGTEVYVYGFSKQVDMTVAAFWSNNSVIEESWVTVCADSDVTVTVWLADDTPITEAKVYPEDVATSYISGGRLVITSPQNQRFRVEINGDRAECFHLFIAPPFTAPSGTSYTSSAVTKAISSFDYTTGLFVSPGHGLADGDAVILKSTGSLPSPMPQHWISYVIFSDTDKFQLAPTADLAGSKVPWPLTDNGSGTMTVSRASWSSATPLIFPAGEHQIGRLFDVGSDTTIVLSPGAVVVGSFDLRSTNGARFKGRGILSGEYSDYEGVVKFLPYDTKLTYSLFYGDLGEPYTDNEVEGITLLASPFYCMINALTRCVNVHVISMWTFENDGIRLNPRSAEDKTSSLESSFVFAGDDSIVLFGTDSMTVTDTFGVTVTNGTFDFNYVPDGPRGRITTITNCHAMHLGKADTGGDVTNPFKGMNSIIKAWIDGYDYEEDLGRFDLTVNGLHVWGTNSRLLSFGPRPYPFSEYVAHGGYGQVAYFELNDITVHCRPPQLAELMAKDATSTTHDIAFTNLVIDEVPVTQDNALVYFDIDPLTYGITFTVTDAEATFLVEDGSGLEETANAYCSVAFADDYHAKFGNPSAWSLLSTTQKQDAIRVATRAADERYGGRWPGVRANPDTQALDWPRAYVVDRDGYEVSSTSIPTPIARWTARAALLHVQGYDLLPSTQDSATVTSETLTSSSGASESRTYKGGLEPTTQFPALDRMLTNAGLAESGGGWMGAEA